MAPSPNRYHQDISYNLEFLFRAWVQENPIGRFYHAPCDVEFTDDTVLQPDILFVSNERAHILADFGVKGAPDFVVEILSPHTAQVDRERKRAIYARHGVREMWIIAPTAQTIQVYDLGSQPGEPVATYGIDDVIERDLFPGLRVEARRVFAR